MDLIVYKRILGNTNFENLALQILIIHLPNITSIHKTKDLKNHKTKYIYFFLGDQYNIGMAE